MTTKSPSDRDYRALIAIVLLVVTGVVAVYGMYLGWSTIDILALMAFFGPLLTAAITYYFIGKTTEKSRQTTT